jgi:precorrin-6x reductase
MVRAVVFGGTTEGRKICEFCADVGIPIRYCAATADGARAAEGFSNTRVSAGRLNAAEMSALFHRDIPTLAVDATHPYAGEASRNIAEACQEAGVPLLRVTRESAEKRGCLLFGGIGELLAWLEREPGNIFVTLGSSHAGVFSVLPDYQSRVWIRVLPSIDSLRTCLDSGYSPERIICMRGPFSEELNRAMFQYANARILVTKDSGAAGGILEKIQAARSLGMLTAVLSKPTETAGVSLEEACQKIAELTK